MWPLTGNGPDDAIVIEALPFSTSGDSSLFTSTVTLGGGPDVFYVFTSETMVRWMGDARGTMGGMGGTVIELKDGVELWVVE